MNYGDQELRLSLTTAPAEEPLTIQEVKDHLRLDHDEENAFLKNLVKGARLACERVTGLQLVTATWAWKMDCLPCWELRFPKPPLQSVSGITYVDTAGTTQTWASSKYTVDAVSVPGRLTPTYTESWPSYRNVINAVTVNFVAGYGAATAVPWDIKERLLVWINHRYLHREDPDEMYLDKLFTALCYGEYV